MVVAAAAGVEFAADIADALDQLAFDKAVDVLGPLGEAAIQEGFVGEAFLEDLLEGRLEELGFLIGQDFGMTEAFGISETSLDIGLEEAAVKRERRVESCKGFVGGAGESASPEFRHRGGSPFSLGLGLDFSWFALGSGAPTFP